MYHEQCPTKTAHTVQEKIHTLEHDNFRPLHGMIHTQLRYPGYESYNARDKERGYE